MMENVLTIGQYAGVLLEYAICIVVILGGLIAIACLRRRQRKELTAEHLKNRILKAKKYGESVLNYAKERGVKEVLVVTKLYKLSKYLNEASWVAYQIVEVKKDILFEGIATSIDGVSTALSKEIETGFVSAEDYQKDVQTTIDALTEVLARVDAVKGK